VQFLVTSHTGSDSHRMNGNLVLGEKLRGAVRIAGQEHSMSFARKDRLRQAQDAQVISDHENSVFRPILVLSLHSNHLFSTLQAECGPAVSIWPDQINSRF